MDISSEGAVRLSIPQLGTIRIKQPSRRQCASIADGCFRRSRPKARLSESPNKLDISALLRCATSCLIEWLVAQKLHGEIDSVFEPKSSKRTWGFKVGFDHVRTNEMQDLQ